MHDLWNPDIFIQYTVTNRDVFRTEGALDASVMLYAVWHIYLL